MTEPPQPCAPATTTTPQSGHTISLCPHTHTHRCIEKLLTPRQQYVLYLCAQGGFSRKKNGCTRTVSSLLSCVLFYLFIFFNDCLSRNSTIYRPLIILEEHQERCDALLLFVCAGKNNHHSEHTCGVPLCHFIKLHFCFFFV